MSLSLLDLQFVLLLLAVAVGRRVLPLSWHVRFGAVASAALIGLASPRTLVALGGITLLYLLPARALIVRAKASSQKTAKVIALTSIFGLVAMMVLFKVHLFFEVPFLHGSRLGKEIVALIGFSYFLFRAINYLYMHYLMDLGRDDPLMVLYYTIFPPTLTSGPIHKFVDFKKQTEKVRQLDWPTFRDGVYRITRGYFRKMVIAFAIDGLVNRLLEANQWNTATSALLIASLYVFFYFDFAGYSDIAIGFGQILGIKVPENFRTPFKATSITEFWRHYHITLADWLRDHVFIPLGGMRASRTKAGAITFVLMVLCGLWHGLTIPFLLWGLWHGTMLLAEGIAGSKPIPPAKRKGPKYWGRVAFTNVRISIGALFFLPSLDVVKGVLLGLIQPLG